MCFDGTVSFRDSSIANGGRTCAAVASGFLANLGREALPGAMPAHVLTEKQRGTSLSERSYDTERNSGSAVLRTIDLRADGGDVAGHLGTVESNSSQRTEQDAPALLRGDVVGHCAIPQTQVATNEYHSPAEVSRVAGNHSARNGNWNSATFELRQSAAFIPSRILRDE